MADQTPFINGSYYHVYNRGARKGDIFFNDEDYQRWEDLLYWCLRYSYTYSSYLARLVHARKKGNDIREIIDEIDQKHRLKSSPVEIIAYVHMPNHYHLLLKQIEKSGISKYIHRVATGYAKYVNLKYDMSGSLYKGPMQAVMIRSNRQLVNVARYIHTNPISAGLATVHNLADFPWSSYSAYIKEMDNKALTKTHLLEYFDNKIEEFDKFTREPFTDVRELEGLTIDDDYKWFSS